MPSLASAKCSASRHSLSEGSNFAGGTINNVQRPNRQYQSALSVSTLLSAHSDSSAQQEPPGSLAEGGNYNSDAHEGDAEGDGSNEDEEGRKCLRGEASSMGREKTVEKGVSRKEISSAAMSCNS